MTERLAQSRRRAPRLGSRSPRRCSGLYGARAGFPGISSLTSTACIYTIGRSRGYFRSFRGLDLLLRDWLLVTCYSTIRRRRIRRRRRFYLVLEEQGSACFLWGSNFSL